MNNTSKNYGITEVITRGTIIMAELPENKNSVQNGKRPCLVVSNNKGNQYSPVLIVVPLTSRITKKAMPTHYYVEPNEMNGLKAKSVALAEQILTIGKDMVIGKLGELSDIEMRTFDSKLKKSLSLF